MMNCVVVVVVVVVIIMMPILFLMILVRADIFVHVCVFLNPFCRFTLRCMADLRRKRSIILKEDYKYEKEEHTLI